MTRSSGRALKAALLAATVVAAVPVAAHAHRAWLLPSATVLSGEDAWLTVDAAIANTLFYFDHNPMPLTNLSVYAPDGSKLEPQNVSQGQYRSTFDVELVQNGTYNVEVFNNTVSAVYTDENGAEQRFRGTPAEWEASELSQRDDLQPTFNATRTEFFVTVGAPTEMTVQPAGEGLELVPLVHPNDLYSGEAAQFRVLLNGEPVADQAVEVIAGGVRYRDAEDPIQVTTDANGEFEVTWPEPGMYWVNAEYGQTGRGAPAGARGAAYNGTFEVLPQ
jgi:uncharacterized GH25 family protein